MGLQGRELSSAFAFCSTVSSWCTLTLHLHMEAALPAPALGGIQPGTSSSPAGKPGTKALCPLPPPCPALPFYASSSNSGIRANGKGKASACKCSDHGETRGLVLCRLPRKTGLSRQKGLRRDASSHQISRRNNNSLAKC